ncbi:hypothetical protein [Streptococcus hyointestinalis]|uniref:hypothetical protein n=1 Tax=Streptococcus hyointestinalis TaxID=1337 RepID=UPI0013DED92F|nr:hypothetical protein [Streptococcus hyointestinalis]
MLTWLGLLHAVEDYILKHKAQGIKARLNNLASAFAHIILGTIGKTWRGEAAKLLSFPVGLNQRMMALVN